MSNYQQNDPPPQKPDANQRIELKNNSTNGADDKNEIIDALANLRETKQGESWAFGFSCGFVAGFLLSMLLGHR